MNLNPTVRWLLGAVAAGVTAFGGLIAADEVLAATLPPWVGIVISVLGAVFSFLNLVPPQVGGTQQGVVNPTVVEPPTANIEEK